MAFTFPGAGLPDAGFLCAMVARADGTVRAIN
jgi:hypothetical protein